VVALVPIKVHVIERRHTSVCSGSKLLNDVSNFLLKELDGSVRDNYADRTVSDSSARLRSRWIVQAVNLLPLRVTWPFEFNFP
jgi:hypothetical protein